jgi:plasmid stabilization system protein ParE
MVGNIFRVIFSSKARKQLKEISDYQTRIASPTVAKKIRSEIRKEAAKLENLPASKPILPGTEDRKEEIRYAKKWSYKIIFQVLNPKNLVRILMVRHDAEDLDDILDDL